MCFYPLFVLLTNQKQESGFQQVGGLVTRNICFLFIAIPNLIDFFKGIFLHVIPVHIIVSWPNFTCK